MRPTTGITPSDADDLASLVDQLFCWLDGSSADVVASLDDHAGDPGVHHWVLAELDRWSHRLHREAEAWR